MGSGGCGGAGTIGPRVTGPRLIGLGVTGPRVIGPRGTMVSDQWKKNGSIEGWTTVTPLVLRSREFVQSAARW